MCVYNYITAKNKYHSCIQDVYIVVRCIWLKYICFVYCSINLYKLNYLTLNYTHTHTHTLILLHIFHVSSLAVCKRRNGALSVWLSEFVWFYRFYWLYWLVEAVVQYQQIHQLCGCEITTSITCLSRGPSQPTSTLSLSLHALTAIIGSLSLAA